ncbi:MAG: hypothetical protein RLZ98_2022 [Pseudomonadota bacterium]
MLEEGKIYLGTSAKGGEYLDLKLANRHGLITGATGTGKTVSLQVLAEGFSNAGVPVFAADIKGDLSGVAAPGEPKDFITKRLADIGLAENEFEFQEHPVVFWDVFGELGHPVRTTVADMGPLLLSRMLELNEVQEGVLNIAFRVAADEVKEGNKDFVLVNLDDLRSMLDYIANAGNDKARKYGNVAATSVGAIQRRLLVLEGQGGDKFLQEPALDIDDFMRTERGKGVINILAADKLMEKPKLYGTFLLWMLSELWRTLPEVGDQPKPKFVFFFDEAHLLFDEAPDALLERIQQIARLVRSKGVGVYFITQNPLDVPDTVSSQIGNRVQHALRAFTPKEQRAIRAAAETFRENPAIDTEEAIKELTVGEALVSMLENRGEPSMVQRTLIRPPEGRIGPLKDAERRELIEKSPFYGKYEDTLDRESAHEILMQRAKALAEKEAELEAQEAAASNSWGKTIFGRGPRGGMSVGENIARDVGRSIMRSIITEIKNSVLRSIGLKRGRR